jgi:(p)ppGpp synthase/HD superfamily hydrolase
MGRRPQGRVRHRDRVEVGNQRGALATIASAIAEQGSNIENVQSREKGRHDHDAGLHHQRQEPQITSR